MTSPQAGSITQLLNQAGAGDKAAEQKLFDAVYGQLRAIAEALMRRERPDHTISATALVSEAYLRLVGSGTMAPMPNRRYFFGAASRAMGQILVDYGRARAAEKRGGEFCRVAVFDERLASVEQNHLEMLDLQAALARLAALNARQSQVVSLRFLMGMTVPEVSEALEVSVSTVENDWRIARAWLRRELDAGSRPTGDAR